jgi:hypothetical protein
MLFDGDDAAAFMMQATGMDETGVAGVVQTGKVAFLEVGEGRGERVGVFLFVGLGGADEFRRRTEVPFREGHDTFQFGIQSSLGWQRRPLNAGNLTEEMRDRPGLVWSKTKDPAKWPGLVGNSGRLS